MRVFWVVVGSVFLLLVASCGAASRNLAARAGCAAVEVDETNVGRQVVTVIVAWGCRDAGGVPLPAPVVVDELAGSVWTSLRLPVDAIHVAVNPGTNPSRSVASNVVVLPRVLLEERFGPGPRGIVRPVVPRGASDLLWLLLPFAYLVVHLGVVLLAVRDARAGIFFFVIRR